MINTIVPSFESSTIEIHYWFVDETHSMDAFVQNKCEYEFLNIVKDIAAVFDVDILIEIEPLTNGGVKQKFKIYLKSKEKKTIRTTVISSIISSIIVGFFINPVTTLITEIEKKEIVNMFEDNELKELEKEKIRKEIDNLNIDIELKRQKLNQNKVLKKRRSNFYKTLKKYPKVIKVSYVIKGRNNNVSDESYVSRDNFNEFILVPDNLEPIIVNNAIIEIISPVLIEGTYKWKGIYNGKTISFDMKSEEFKSLVQTRQIKFENGFIIHCKLEIERRINSGGKEQITSYNIIRVDKYFVNNRPVETPEGKINREIQDSNNE